MSTTDPIRTSDEVREIIEYFISRGEWRNAMLISLGLHTAIRISDILSLRWGDLYDFEKGVYKNHISVTEKKTNKKKRIALNEEMRKMLTIYKDNIRYDINASTYLIKSTRGKGRPISRQQAYRIIKEASQNIGIPGNISCHSLRKTFGYFAWKQGASPAILMEIYNHSSYKITRSYLCINQDDKDKIYKEIIFY